MSQLLVRQLQLLLVMAVLLHFGLKVTQLLLKEQEKEREASTEGSPYIRCTAAQLIYSSDIDNRGSVTQTFQVMHGPRYN